MDNFLHSGIDCNTLSQQVIASKGEILEQPRDDEAFYEALIKEIYGQDHICEPVANAPEPYPWTEKEVREICAAVDKLFNEPEGFNFAQLKAVSNSNVNIGE